VELDTPDGGVLSENVEVWFPAVWYKAPELDSENEPFNQARNLDELSKIWDTVALTTKFWKLDRPKLFFLRIRNFPETETGLLAHEIPENPPASTLSQAAPAIELAPNGSPTPASCSPLQLTPLGRGQFDSTNCHPAIFSIIAILVTNIML
jgi:hypothetical protein